MNDHSIWCLVFSRLLKHSVDTKCSNNLVKSFKRNGLGTLGIWNPFFFFFKSAFIFFHTHTFFVYLKLSKDFPLFVETKGEQRGQRNFYFFLNKTSRSPKKKKSERVFVLFLCSFFSEGTIYMVIAKDLPMGFRKV